VVDTRVYQQVEEGAFGYPSIPCGQKRLT